MSEENKKKVYSVKCVVVGDSGTGKTCITSRLAFDNFSDNPGATIGASNFTHISLLETPPLNWIYGTPRDRRRIVR